MSTIKCYKLISIFRLSEPNRADCSYKNELLFSRGINFDKLPLWQKRGVGIYWGEIEKAGYNPIKNIEEKAIRRDLKVDMNLELGEKYGSLIEKLLGEDKK